MDLPRGFRESFAGDFGEETLELLVKALEEEPSPVSIRRHPQKLSIDTAGPIPWCPEALLLDERPLFGADPLWHAGAYYVQEPASMAIASYLDRIDFTPQLALDLCAAPGGKTTLLRSHLPAETLLVANEPDLKRVEVLEENLLRWGAEETIVTSAYPDRLLASQLSFDLILVDAPCSGEGMFRKEPEALHGWSPELVERCAHTQREILRDAWQLLAEDGLLIYSTCTYNRRENESHLRYLREQYHAEVVRMPELVAAGAVESEVEEGLLRFFPHRTRSEGLSCFAVRKRAPQLCHTSLRRVRRSRVAPPDDLTALPTDRLSHSERSGDWRLLSLRGEQVKMLLESLPGVSIKYAGVMLGRQKGRTFVPDIAWALSKTTSAAMPYARRAVSAEESFALISRQSILPGGGAAGYRLATYCGVPLTPIKELGSRVNNLYPKALALHDVRLTPDDMPRISLLFDKK